jgi:hypothetical protein
MEFDLLSYAVQSIGLLVELASMPTTGESFTFGGDLSNTDRLKRHRKQRAVEFNRKTLKSNLN